MPHPNITSEQIETPSIDTPMGGFSGQACGASYNLTFDVYQPYGGLNTHSYKLLEIRDEIIPKQVGQLTASELDSLGSMMGAPAEAIVWAQSMLDGEDAILPVRLVASSPDHSASPPRVLDAKNVQAIQHLIDRAVYYGDLATKLWNYWAEEWQPTVLEEIPTEGPDFGVAAIQKEMPNWPLNVRFSDIPTMKNCADKGDNAKFLASALGGAWSAWVECPNQITRFAHEQNVELFQELVLASLLWARCAQEAAAVMGVYHLNKLEKMSQGGGQLGLAPQEPSPEVPDPGNPPPLPPPILGGGDPTPLPTPGFVPSAPTPPVPPTLSEPPTTTPAKTGLSTPVKVAAAAAALYVVYRLYS